MKKCPFCAEEIQDAAIVCKHCQRDLPSPPSPPPPPPAPMEKKSIGIVIAWYVVIFAAVIICAGLIIVAVVMQLSNAAPSSPGSSELKPIVTFDGDTVKVKSEDNTEWTGLHTRINKDYDCTVIASVLPGEEVVLALRNCANSNGLRFEPLAMKVQSIYLRATLLGTEATWGGVPK